MVYMEVQGALQNVPKVLEPDPSLHYDLGLELAEAVIQVSEMGKAPVLVTNNSGFTQHVNSSTLLGEAVEALILNTGEALTSVSGGSQSACEDSPPDKEWCEVWRIGEGDDERKRRLLEMVKESELLDPEQAECLRNFLINHHHVFSTNRDEQGETELVQVEVDILATACAPYVFCSEAEGCQAAERDAAVRCSLALQKPLGQPHCVGQEVG